MPSMDAECGTIVTKSQEVSSKYFSFIIWKDYNCAAWQTIGNSDFIAVPDRNMALYAQTGRVINNVYFTLKSKPYDDVWDTSFKLIDYINSQNAG